MVRRLTLDQLCGGSIPSISALAIDDYSFKVLDGCLDVRFLKMAVLR